MDVVKSSTSALIYTSSAGRRTARRDTNTFMWSTSRDNRSVATRCSAACAMRTATMAEAAVGERNSGFDFSGHGRNAMLSARGHVVPRATSTGTTIVGLIYKGGVVLGADTRATEGPIVADKNCEKIHYITESIRCCGAGTAADTEFVTSLISSNMQLHELHTRKRPRVLAAMTMLKQRLFQYQGYIGAALVLGGYDATGPQLFTIAPHGSTDKLPYVTMGSGSLAAMSVFESRWRPDMEVCCVLYAC